MRRCAVVGLVVLAGCSEDAAAPPVPPAPCQALTADGGGGTVGSGGAGIRRRRGPRSCTPAAPR